MTIDDALRETIKNYLDKKQISLNQFCKSVGVSPSIISRFMSGKHKDMSFKNAMTILHGIGKIEPLMYRRGFYVVFDYPHSSQQDKIKDGS